MLFDLFLVAAGFVFLGFGAGRFVLGSSVIARRSGVPSLLVGLLVAGIGTSMPEILVSVLASLDGNTGLVIGNTIGSNIANIGLVLGASALASPLIVKSTILRREFPALFLVVFLSVILMYDGYLSRSDGFIFLFGFLIMIYWMISISASSKKDDLKSEYEAEDETHYNLSKRSAWLWASIGLGVLLLGSKMVVTGAVAIAVSLGVSDLIIGLVVIGIGTSLPELSTSVMSVIKGEYDIALGNVIGSCMFNLLAVMCIPALMHPSAFPVEVLSRDLPIMTAFTLALFGVAYGFRSPGVVTRTEGVSLLVAYFAYLFVLFI